MTDPLMGSDDTPATRGTHYRAADGTWKPVHPGPLVTRWAERLRYWWRCL